MQSLKMKKRGILAAALATGLIFSALSAVSPAAAATKIKTIGIAYDLGGRDIPGFNQLAYFGARDFVKTNKSSKIKELQAALSDTDETRAERLRLLAEAGANPIIAVGFTYASSLAIVAAEYPDVYFGIVDDSTVDLPNVQGITFSEQEGSYLVGAIAALASKTGNVGFIGGVATPLIEKFEAGYAAGAKKMNKKIKVQVSYLTVFPDFSGFNDPAKGEEAARGMFDNGADVVYSAAGGSGAGAHKAALAAKTWSIGVDADEWAYPSNKAYKKIILTSMLKNVNVGVQAMIESVAKGNFEAGAVNFDLTNNGVGYSLSGGYAKKYAAKVNKLIKKIKSGKIVVPIAPKK
jgi:basic membrane protein A